MESVRDYDTVYKIGFSKDPKKRKSTVQTGSDGVVNIVYEFKTNHERKVETAMHNLYSHKHKNMEWFDLDIVEVNNFIPMCKQIESNLDMLKNFKYED